MSKKRITIAILVGLLLFVLLQIDRESLLYSIRQIPFWLIILLGILQIITQLLLNLQWYCISQLAKSPLTFRQMLYINCQGSVIDGITPGVKFGGEVTRAVQISRIGKLPGEQSAAIVATQKIFSLSTLFIILMFVIWYLAGQVPFMQTRYFQFITYGVLLLFLVVFVCVFIIPDAMIKFLQKRTPQRLWIRKMYRFMFTLLKQIKSVRKNKTALISLFLLSLLIWLLYPVKMYILAAHFYPANHAVYIGALTFAAYTVAMLPIFPGGLGGFEGTMSALLVSMGYTISDAATMTIAFRFITFWFVMLISLAFIAICRVNKNIA